MALSEHAVAAACAIPDATTKDFVMQQTMLRCKDPQKSLEFYTKVLGMRLLRKLDFPSMQFSLYFVGYADATAIPKNDEDKIKWLFQQKATIELTHNWGTETQEMTYHNGNSDPRGFGHIGISVPDVDTACERFQQLGVKFIKEPNVGKMKGLAFIQDPDGYWIEILSPNNMVNILRGSC